MKNTSRWVAAAFVVLAAAACGKGEKSGDTGATTASAAPASTPAPTAATPPKKEEPKKEEPKKEEPATEGYRTEIHKGTNMKFDLPTSWKIETKGDVLVATTTGAGIEFVGATSGVAAKNDEKAMMAEVGKILQNVKFTSKMKPVEQHGAKGFVVTGTGKKDGAEVEWFTSAIGAGKGALLALGFYSPTISPAVKAQIVHTMDSIAPNK
jgi:hypothetical protein